MTPRSRVDGLELDAQPSVDPLIEAWASMRSFKPKDGPADRPPADGGGRNAERDFHGEGRTNVTHSSTTDADARLIRRGRGKGSQALPDGPPSDGKLERAGRRRAGERGLGPRRIVLLVGAEHAGPPGGAHRATLGADKGYDAAASVAAVHGLYVTPQVAQNTPRRSAIDGRTTRRAGYAVSQRLRQRVAEAFGWIKTTGGLRKTRHRGTARVGWMLTLTAAAANLVRLPKLIEAA